MDVTNGNTNDSAPSIQHKFNGSASEQYVITHVADGYYSIRDVNKKKDGPYLYLHASGTSIGSQAQIYSKQSNGTLRPSQLFRIVKNDSGGAAGSYRLIPKSSNMTRQVGLATGKEQTVNQQLTMQQAEYKYKKDCWYLEKVSTYGCGGKYLQDNSRNTNCLGYALFLNGNIAIPKVQNATSSSSYSNTITQYINSTILNLYPMKNYNKRCYPIAAYNTPIPDTMYRIAFRKHPTIDTFHFIYQLSDGTWAGKNTTANNSKHFGNSNPSSTPAMWDNDAYPSSMGTIYFAVSK
jgi:hypothetical protein